MKYVSFLSHHNTYKLEVEIRFQLIHTYLQSKTMSVFDKSRVHKFNKINLPYTIRIHLRIDRIFCSVHEEITSIRLYTAEQIISINPYKLIQTFIAMILKNIFIFSK